MEPQNPNKQPQPAQRPIEQQPGQGTPNNQTPEVVSRPSVPESKPSKSIERGQENQPSPEKKINSGDAANQNQGMVLPQVVNQPAPAQDQQATQDDDNPAIADDLDLIEKEWVDKAKKVIEEHKDDPYTQEEEVEKLQMDYLKKRFGKEIKKDS